MLSITFFYLVSYLLYTFFHIFRIHIHLFRLISRISHSHFSILYIYFSYFVYLFLLFHIFTFPIKKILYIFQINILLVKFIFFGYIYISYLYYVSIVILICSIFSKIFVFHIDDFLLLFILKPFSVCFSFCHVAKVAYVPTYLPFIFKPLFFKFSLFFIHILSIYQFYSPTSPLFIHLFPIPFQFVKLI